MLCFCELQRLKDYKNLKIEKYGEKYKNAFNC